MKEAGKVVGFRNGLVEVEVRRTEQCGRCGRCGHFTFADPTLIVEARPAGSMKVGDVVELELRDRDFLTLSFLMYIMPLLGAGAAGLAGYGLGTFWGNSGLLAGLFALLGLVFSFGAVIAIDRKSRREGRFLPVARPLAFPEDRDLA